MSGGSSYRGWSDIVGVFTVEVTLRNWQNQVHPGRGNVCKMSFAKRWLTLVRPNCACRQILWKAWSLVEVGRMRVQTADGGRHFYRLVGMVEVEVQGRSCQSAGPLNCRENSRVLLGAFPLEGMDWHISPREGRLIPNPAFPDGEPTLYALGATAAP